MWGDDRRVCVEKKSLNWNLKDSASLVQLIRLYLGWWDITTSTLYYMIILTQKGGHGGGERLWRSHLSRDDEYNKLGNYWCLITTVQGTYIPRRSSVRRNKPHSAVRICRKTSGPFSFLSKLSLYYSGIPYLTISTKQERQKKRKIKIKLGNRKTRPLSTEQGKKI